MRINDFDYTASEDRIEGLTVLFSLLSMGIVWVVFGRFAALALLCGAGASWLNFRWLRQGVRSLLPASIDQEGGGRPRVRKSTYAKLLGRYSLLIVVAYVILSRFRLPAVPFVSGLFAPVAAVMAEMIYQLIRSTSDSTTA